MTTQLSVIDAVRSDLTKMQPQFKAALPLHVSPEKFQRVLLTAVQQTPALLNADRRSLFGAAMRAAQDGLLPDGREGAIVTFKDQAQWMPMVAGIMKKVRNSGEVSTWSVQVVKSGDVFDFQLGDDERIDHKPALKDRGETIGAYSIVTMKDGEKSREWMNIDEIKAIQKRSRSGNSGPWVSDFDEMAKKTVVRRHAKRLPMSTDLDEFMRQDDELFMPPEQPAKDVTPAAEPQTTAQKGRNSKLQKVVDADIDDDMPPPLDVQDIPSADSDEYPI